MDRYFRNTFFVNFLIDKNIDYNGEDIAEIFIITGKIINYRPNGEGRAEISEHPFWHFLILFSCLICLRDIELWAHRV